MSILSVRKIIACCLLIFTWLIFTENTAYAVSNDGTHVSLDGNIIDTPCTIEPGSRDQTIAMGSVPVAIIARNGAGRKVPFSIQLKDCKLARFNQHLPDWQGIQIFFDGITDGQNFSVQGSAEGVALRIIDADGHIVVPGNPLPSVQIMAGNQTLNFRMQLVSNHKSLNKGEYHAVIQFGLSYF